jgi:hypothetical protein
MVVLGERTPTRLAVVHVTAVLDVCTVSQRAQLTAAGRLVAMHQCSARLSWTPQETAGVAAKLTLHTWVGLQATLHVGPQPHRRSLLTLLCHPPSTGHPPRFVVEACSEGPSHECMPTCVGTAHLHQPAPTTNSPAQDGNSRLRGLVSPPSHPRTDVNTCKDATPSPLTPLSRLPPRTA